MGEEFQNTELHVPPKEAHFNLKQANKATVSFPIKIFPNKTSGTGLGSLAQVAKHPAKGRLCRSQRITGRVRPPHPRASAMDFAVCLRKGEYTGCPRTGRGESPSHSQADLSFRSLGGSGWTPLQPSAVYPLTLSLSKRSSSGCLFSINSCKFLKT